VPSCNFDPSQVLVLVRSRFGWPTLLVIHLTFSHLINLHPHICFVVPHPLGDSLSGRRSRPSDTSNEPRPPPIARRPPPASSSHRNRWPLARSDPCPRTRLARCPTSLIRGTAAWVRLAGGGCGGRWRDIRHDRARGPGGTVTPVWTCFGVEQPQLQIQIQLTPRPPMLSLANAQPCPWSMRVSTASSLSNW